MNPGMSKLLRDAADDFLLILLVAAESVGEKPSDLIESTLKDASARLQESGAIGADPEL